MCYKKITFGKQEAARGWLSKFRRQTTKVFLKITIKLKSAHIAGTGCYCRGGNGKFLYLTAFIVENIIIFREKLVIFRKYM